MERPEDFAKYIEYAHEQIRELLTNYGPIAGIWFDPIMAYYAQPDLFPIHETYAMVRRLQPQILISFKQGATGTEDFAAPERSGASLADRVKSSGSVTSRSTSPRNRGNRTRRSTTRSATPCSPGSGAIRRTTTASTTLATTCSASWRRGGAELQPAFEHGPAARRLDPPGRRRNAPPGRPLHPPKRLADRRAMAERDRGRALRNDEWRNQNDEGSPNAQMTKRVPGRLPLRASSFGVLSSFDFVIRH